jgi:hypothetical protein
VINTNVKRRIVAALSKDSGANAKKNRTLQLGWNSRKSFTAGAGLLSVPLAS